MVRNSQIITNRFAVGYYFYAKEGGFEPQVYKSEVCAANERRAKLGSTRSHHTVETKKMSPTKKPDFIGLFCYPNGDFSLCRNTDVKSPFSLCGRTRTPEN